MNFNSFDEIKYYIALSSNQKISIQKLGKILVAFGSFAKAWEAGENDFKRLGFEEELIFEINNIKQNSNAFAVLSEVEKLGLNLYLRDSKEYPELLREISTPPYLLYARGEILPQDELAVAIVGTRMPTAYGRQIAYDLAYNIAKNGITVISGLALGTDSAAHQGALDANGRTIAVLGCGADTIYPISNRALAEKIQKQGAIISEFPLGMPPLKQNFPARNRIISGMSLGTVVVEAPEDSGSLITARFALEQGREVFGVPGNVTSKMSDGPNNLIKMGAKAVTSHSDIIDELNLAQVLGETGAKEIIADSKDEAEILKHLSKEPAHIDSIVRQSGLETSIVGSTLTLMEMKGKVRNISGAGYIINN